MAIVTPSGREIGRDWAVTICGARKSARRAIMVFMVVGIGNSESFMSAKDQTWVKDKQRPQTKFFTEFCAPWSINS